MNLLEGPRQIWPRASHKREKYVNEKEKVSRGAMGFP